MVTVKLFILAHAGGNVWNYVTLFSNIKGIEIIPIELSGDFTKLHEPTLETLEDYVEDVKKKILHNCDGESFMLFGHSFGAYIAFELSSVFDTSQLILVFLSGCSPLNARLNINDFDNVLLKESNDVELNKIIQLINTNIKRKIYLVNNYRLKKYHETPKVVNSHSHICVLCGTRDPFAIMNSEWKLYFDAKLFKLEYIQGGHFYWKENEENRKKLLDIVRREIEFSQQGNVMNENRINKD